MLSEDLSGDLSRSSYGKHLLADAKGTKLFVFFFCLVFAGWCFDERETITNTIIVAFETLQALPPPPYWEGGRGRMLDGKLAGQAGYLMETNLGKTRALSTTKKHDV